MIEAPGAGTGRARRHRPRPSRWRTLVFAPVGDGSTRRRASDVVRLVLAVVVLAVVLVVVRHDGSLDLSFAQAVTPAPQAVQWVLSTFWVLGSVGAVVAVLVLALLAGRFRLARDTVVAAVGTTLVCVALGAWLGPDGGRPAGTATSELHPAFPLWRIAMTVAVVLVVAPYLSRSMRRLLLVLVGLASLAGLVQGHGLPLDLVASLVLGWGAAAAVHLALESPTGLPSSSEVADAADDLGFELDQVAGVHPQVWGVAGFTTRHGGAPVEVSVYGRDASDAQLLSKLGRFLWYRDSGPTLSLTRLQQVEHEAYLSLAAARAGVSAPDVLVAALDSSGEDALLITEPPPGRRLEDLDPSTLDDAQLDAVFEQLDRLRRGGLAHGAISPATIVVDDDGRAGLPRVPHRHLLRADRAARSRSGRGAGVVGRSGGGRALGGLGGADGGRGRGDRGAAPGAARGARSGHPRPAPRPQGPQGAAGPGARRRARPRRPRRCRSWPRSTGSASAGCSWRSARWWA